MIEAKYRKLSLAERRFDWIAYFHGKEDSAPYGFGATENEAKLDLVKGLVEIVGNLFQKQGMKPDFSDIALHELLAKQTHASKADRR